MNTVKKIRLGNFELFFLRNGSFWLDGGGCFGIVPKIIWRKLVYADELNRVKLDSNSLLIRTDEHNILIDPGLGNKYSEKQKKIFRIENKPSIDQSLTELGITSDDIDIVIATHLHFDHIGAFTKYDNQSDIQGDRNIVPSFPNAIHYIQKGEWQEAISPNERTKGTYFITNYMPLMDAGLVKLIEGNQEICPGISVEITGGHTKYHQIVFIKSQANIAVYLGDIMPTANHIKVAYTTGFDLYPVEVMRKKRELYQRAIDENWIVCLDHDSKNCAGYIRQTPDAKNYTFQPYEFT